MLFVIDGCASCVQARPGLLGESEIDLARSRLLTKPETMLELAAACVIYPAVNHADNACPMGWKVITRANSIINDGQGRENEMTVRALLQACTNGAGVMRMTACWHIWARGAAGV
jgi:hypothetical protein